MERQLLLLEAPAADWKLDDETKELGLRNVAKARQVLASARAAAHAAEQAAARRDAVRNRSAGHHHPHAA